MNEIIKPIEPDNNPNPNLWKWVIVILLLFAAIVFFTSCSVLKGKHRINSDSTALHKSVTSLVDTGTGGSIHKNNTNTHEANDWWRTTLQYPRDTSIHNTYVYPSTVVYEGGKGTKDVQSNTIDSGWFKNALSVMVSQVDSLSKKLSETEKTKETKPSIWFYVIIGAVILIAWKGLGFVWTWFTGKYHILLPKNKA